MHHQITIIYPINDSSIKSYLEIRFLYEIEHNSIYFRLHHHQVVNPTIPLQHILLQYKSTP